MPDMGPLDPRRKSAAVETISKAFFDDPLSAYIQPNESKRMRVLRGQMRMLVQLGMRDGLIDATPDAKGLVLWMKPGSQQVTPTALLRAGVLAVPFRTGFGPLGRLLSVLNEGEEAHEEAIQEPHWYLAVAAVDPALHGHGIGTALVERGVARADVEGAPCYLETSRERNLAYWQRFGFEVASEQLIGKSSSPFWSMVRPAQV